MIAITYGLAAELPLVLRRVPAPRLPPVAGPTGLIVQAAGLALRAWSMRTLGSSYTRTLVAGREQHVVDTGPYRLVRHPGYTGSLLTWTGFALASRSAPVVVMVAALLGRAYYRRILAEEQLLQRDLVGYAAYSEHTKRLVPFIW
jgi:protein-S-isoprenylcysteine O-methyltransferase Ste14